MRHILIVLCFCHLVDGMNVSVMEGESVTLHCNLTDGHGNYEGKQIWTGPDGNNIFTAFWGFNKIEHIIYDERFRHRLQIDNQTGSLTIRNITTTDSGLYRMYSRYKMPLLFNITVYAPSSSSHAAFHIPRPIISRDSSNIFSSSGSCSLLCAVVNVSHVTLSWFKGHSLISSTSVSDVISSVSLHLEVEDQDSSSYRCEINNPVTNQTTHLDINQLCQDSVQCGFSFTEAVIQLVASAVVGVATVAIVLYDITSRRAEHKSRE